MYYYCYYYLFVWADRVQMVDAGCKYVHQSLARRPRRARAGPITERRAGGAPGSCSPTSTPTGSGGTAPSEARRRRRRLRRLWCGVGKASGASRRGGACKLGQYIIHMLNHTFWLLRGPRRLAWAADLLAMSRINRCMRKMSHRDRGTCAPRWCTNRSVWSVAPLEMEMEQVALAFALIKRRRAASAAAPTAQAADAELHYLRQRVAATQSEEMALPGLALCTRTAADLDWHDRLSAWLEQRHDGQSESVVRTGIDLLDGLVLGRQPVFDAVGGHEAVDRVVQRVLRAEGRGATAAVGFAQRVCEATLAAPHSTTGPAWLVGVQCLLTQIAMKAGSAALSVLAGTTLALVTAVRSDPQKHEPLVLVVQPVLGALEAALEARPASLRAGKEPLPTSAATAHEGEWRRLLQQAFDESLDLGACPLLAHRIWALSLLASRPAGSVEEGGSSVKASDKHGVERLTIHRHGHGSSVVALL